MSKKDDILLEAKERLTAALDWEDGARSRARDDYRFVNGDPDNMYQWPAELLKMRELDKKPSLTINKVRQHCLQIVNDARQNRVEVKIDAVGDGATYESAQCMQDLVRHIEYQSQAQDVYINAVTFQVFTGIGFWRVLTDYVDDKSFDQEIYIRRIKDPGMVVMDPDINELDGSDARYGFVYEDLPDDLFAKRYPKWKDRANNSTLGIGLDDDAPKDHTRICEYFRRVEKKDRLYLTDTGTVTRSEVGDEIAAGLDADKSVQKRDILTQSIEWYLIIGNEIAEERDWPGRYIPIVRLVGEESVIDGKLDRKGHVRALKDPQRMYNYWSSAAVEFGALQSKVPWIIPIEAVEGVEQYWESANRTNYAYLPYKARLDSGEVLPPPQRAQPPQAAQAFLAGMQTAAQELMMASGQYQAQMGEQSNERTGIAIQERQRQGDNATYHYIANLASAIRYTGRILIDLIPHIYDTERVIKIMQEDGSQSEVQINPGLQQPAQVSDEQGTVQRILNPAVGRYEVQSDVGPAFATRRQEAFNALIQLAQASPDLMSKAGDLVMRAADFPMADELADRLVPPQVDPAMQQAQQQMQQLQQANTALMEHLAAQKAKHTAVEQQKDIDVYRAETDRMSALSKVDPAALMPLIHQMVRDALQTHLGNVTEASQTAIHQAYPVHNQPVSAPAPFDLPQDQTNAQTPPGALPGQPTEVTQQ